MRIEIEKLTEAGQPFAHTYAPGELSLEEEYARLLSEVKLAGQVSRKRQRVHVRGSVGAEIEVSCDRCLAPARVPVNAEFDLSYDPPDADEASENAELQPDDLVTSVYTDESLDMDELVREQLLLALPTRNLCRAECQGLCPTCGADLNKQPCDCAQKEIDPRWAALAQLKESSDE